LLAVIAAAQTSTTEKIDNGTTTVTTKLSGVVKYVEGNTLVATMSNGELREFTVPDTQKFIIDGKPRTVRDLKPGTSLTGTVVTSTTSITDRTTTSLSATVFWVAGNDVILTLPTGGNKMYKVQDHYKFKVDGKDTDVSALRRGMKISAEKIVEEPSSEIAANTTVVGHAPTPVQ
jgi:hypothetical protein